MMQLKFVVLLLSFVAVTLGNAAVVGERLESPTPEVKQQDEVITNPIVLDEDLDSSATFGRRYYYPKYYYPQGNYYPSGYNYILTDIITKNIHTISIRTFLIAIAMLTKSNMFSYVRTLYAYTCRAFHTNSGTLYIYPHLHFSKALCYYRHISFRKMYRIFDFQLPIGPGLMTTCTSIAFNTLPDFTEPRAY